MLQPRSLVVSVAVLCPLLLPLVRLSRCRRRPLGLWWCVRWLFYAHA